MSQVVEEHSPGWAEPFRWAGLSQMGGAHAAPPGGQLAAILGEAVAVWAMLPIAPSPWGLLVGQPLGSRSGPPQVSPLRLRHSWHTTVVALGCAAAVGPGPDPAAGAAWGSRAVQAL